MNNDYVMKDRYKEIDYRWYRNGKSNKIIVSGSGSGPTRKLTINSILENALEKYNLSMIHFDIQNGDFIQTVGKMSEKFHDIIELSKTEGYGIDKIGIMGTSLSRLPAMIASSEYKNMNLFLNSPMIYMQEMADKYLNTFHRYYWRVRRTIKKDGRKAHYSTYSTWRDTELAEIFERLKKKSNKIHILHGDGDDEILLDYSLRFQESMEENSVKSDLTILEGVAHNLHKNYLISDFTSNLLCDFFLSK